MNEVLEITDCPSFLKCQQFIENVGNEYIVDVKDEIFYRDLLNLTKSIFKKIKADSTFLAFGLLEKILKYLEKYLYHNTMKYILKLYEEIIMTGTETKYQTAVYHFYKGVEICWELNSNTGIEYLYEALSLLKPFDKSNAELAINIYHKLFKYYLFPLNEKQILHCAKSIIELRTLYDSNDSLDYEYENLLLTLASNHMNTKEIETILESPELKLFIDRIEKEGALDIPKEDFLKDIEKVDPNEFPILNPIYQNIKEDLQDMALSQQGDISYMDVMTRVFDNIGKYINVNNFKN